MEHVDALESSAILSAHRSRLYGLLSSAYRFPSNEFCEAVEAERFRHEVQATVRGLPYQLAGDSDLGSLTGASAIPLTEVYTGVFDVGSPAGPPCFLYEGHHGSGRLGVMTDLLRFYHFFGLRLSPSEHDLPDHLATELEFLHVLTFRETEARQAGNVDLATAYLAATGDFLAAHAQSLARRVAQGMATTGAPFYASLARLTAELCGCDLEYARQPHAGMAEGSHRSAPIRLDLNLRGLEPDDSAPEVSSEYSLREVRRRPLVWDRIVKATHLTSCTSQRSCNFNLYVSDGVVLREEQAANYPVPNDPSIPDANPRGCQKGLCYTHRMYDPTRLKYPLKRVGERGGGQWQRIGWDQALTEIADQLIDVLETDGPDAIIPGGGTHVHSFGSDGAGSSAVLEGMGVALPMVNTEIGDDHQGAVVTLGKAVFGDSPTNWLYADLIVIWGGNPAYTLVPNFHYIVEARYRGTRVISIAPDYNPSSIHADLWVPVNVGTDAALALAMAQVIIRERLYRVDFLREQTDLPLLVRSDTGKLLREKDLKRGGRDDIFYLHDEASGQIVEAPRKSLSLNGLVPSLEGDYQAQTLQGPVRLRPVFEVLRDRLNAGFTPEQATTITGVPATMIERLAREIATAGGVVNINTASFSKFYHGDLMERAEILVFVLCGHMGRKGAGYTSFSVMALDTGLGVWERQGRQMLHTAAGTDPRYAAWKEAGHTPEMILYDYVREAIGNGALASTALTHHIHGGLLEISERNQSWDPDLKRPVGEYLAEALAKKWQVAVPPVGKDPRAMIQWGGNVFRRAKGTKQLLETLLPKLKLVVTIDWRMSSTGLYSDYLLPACGWYERTTTCQQASTQCPFIHVNEKAVEPLFESLGDWAIAVRLARAIGQRARERGIMTIPDRRGVEKRLDRIEEYVTAGGLYMEDDEEAIARDVFTNATNREDVSWEEAKERGIVAFTGIGQGARSLGHATDIQPGEPIVPLTWHTEGKQPYPTATRRIQFYIDHDWYLELDQHLPTHKDPPKVGGDHPFQMTGGHARWSLHSNWIDDSIILSLQRGEPLMFINPQDATARGIEDGDFAEVFNDVGSFRIQAALAPAVRPGQLIVYHAWDNFQFEGWRHFKSVMASPLNPIELVGDYPHIRPDAIACSPGMNDRGTRLEVVKASG